MKLSFTFLQVIFLSCFCIFSSGCWFLVIGGAGAVGGYAVTRDTFEGVSSKGQEELLTAARKVLTIMGTITEENLKDGQIKARVNGNRVTVQVIQINLTTSKLRVKARNALFPRIGVAQEVYTKIMNLME